MKVSSRRLALARSSRGSVAKKKRGGQKTKGVFKTREQLEDRIWCLYWKSDLRLSEIARRAGVSWSTVDKLLAELKKRRKEVPQ